MMPTCTSYLMTKTVLCGVTNVLKVSVAMEGVRLVQHNTNFATVHSQMTWGSGSMELKYCSVPQIRPPSRISPPCVFSAKSCRGIFIPHISPPPQKTTHTHPTVKILFKPLGYLPLKCLQQTWTTRINDGHASYFAKAPCFLALQRWSSSAYC